MNRLPASKLGSKGSGGSVSTMYISVMATTDSGVDNPYTAADVDAAVRVKPLRDLKEFLMNQNAVVNGSEIEPGHLLHHRVKFRLKYTDASVIQ